jgi:hypothetical protein
MITLEALREPITTPLIILEQEYPNWVPARVRAGQPKLVL